MDLDNKCDMLFRLAEGIYELNKDKIDIKLHNDETYKKALKAKFRSEIKRIEVHMPSPKDAPAIPNRHKRAAAFTSAILSTKLIEVDDDVVTSYFQNNPGKSLLGQAVYPNEYLALKFIEIILTADSRRSKKNWNIPADYMIYLPDTAYRFTTDGDESYIFDHDLLKTLHFYNKKQASVKQKQFPLLMFSKLLMSFEIASDCAFYDMKSRYFGGKAG